MSVDTPLTHGPEGNTKTPDIMLLPDLEEEKRYRAWLFVINNYTDTDITLMEDYLDLGGTYIWGYEVGESGTPHVQGYVRFKNARTFSSIKKSFPRAHLKVANGTIKDNLIYCSKENDWKTNIDIKKVMTLL